MKQHWKSLGISPTDDVRAIRQAYAKRLKDIDPDIDLKQFQALRDAYEFALVQAENQSFDISSSEEIESTQVQNENTQKLELETPPFWEAALHTLAQEYGELGEENFLSRIRQLIYHPELDNLALRERFEEAILFWIASLRPYPYRVAELLVQHFSWGIGADYHLSADAAELLDELLNRLASREYVYSLLNPEKPVGFNLLKRIGAQFRVKQSHAAKLLMGPFNLKKWRRYSFWMGVDWKMMDAVYFQIVNNAPFVWEEETSPENRNAWEAWLEEKRNPKKWLRFVQGFKHLFQLPFSTSITFGVLWFSVILGFSVKDIEIQYYAGVVSILLIELLWRLYFFIRRFEHWLLNVETRSKLWNRWPKFAAYAGAVVLTIIAAIFIHRAFPASGARVGRNAVIPMLIYLARGGQLGAFIGWHLGAWLIWIALQGAWWFHHWNVSDMNWFFGWTAYKLFAAVMGGLFCVLIVKWLIQLLRRKFSRQ